MHILINVLTCRILPVWQVRRLLLRPKQRHHIDRQTEKAFRAANRRDDSGLRLRQRPLRLLRGDAVPRLGSQTTAAVPPPRDVVGENINGDPVALDTDGAGHREQDCVRVEVKCK